MKLIPYLQFQDNCEEAIQWYQSIFGGDIQWNRYSEAPMDIPESYKTRYYMPNLLLAITPYWHVTVFPGERSTIPTALP